MNAEKEIFSNKIFELLNKFELAMLELESSPADKGCAGRIFRIIHSIRSTANAAGMSEVYNFTCDVEELFCLADSKRLEVCGELIDLGLAASGRIRSMVTREDHDGAAEENARVLIKHLRCLAEKADRDIGMVNA